MEHVRVKAFYGTAGVYTYTSIWLSAIFRAALSTETMTGNVSNGQINLVWVYKHIYRRVFACIHCKNTRRGLTGVSVMSSSVSILIVRFMWRCIGWIFFIISFCNGVILLEIHLKNPINGAIMQKVYKYID